jgi:hypothetical protein
MPSGMEDSYEYIKYKVIDSILAVVFHLEFRREEIRTHHKKPLSYEMLHRATGLDGFFGTI